MTIGAALSFSSGEYSTTDNAWHTAGQVALGAYANKVFSGIVHVACFNETTGVWAAWDVSFTGASTPSDPNPDFGTSNPVLTVLQKPLALLLTSVDVSSGGGGYLYVQVKGISSTTLKWAYSVEVSIDWAV